MTTANAFGARIISNTTPEEKFMVLSTPIFCSSVIGPSTTSDSKHQLLSEINNKSTTDGFLTFINYKVPTTATNHQPTLLGNDKSPSSTYDTRDDEDTRNDGRCDHDDEHEVRIVDDQYRSGLNERFKISLDLISELCRIGYGWISVGGVHSPPSECPLKKDLSIRSACRHLGIFNENKNNKNHDS